MTDFVFIYTTFPNIPEAEVLAKKAVSEKLAACVNVFPAMKSFYVWEGRTEQADEAVLLFKTHITLTESLKKVILSAHPYKTPCLLSWPVADGYAPYLQWMASSMGL